MTAAPQETTSRTFGTMLLICCGISFLCYVGSYMRIPIVPLYAKSLGADTLEVGVINSAFLLMAGFLSLPLGMVSDRLGRKFLASLGLLILGVTSFLLYFSSTPRQLVWIYVLFGIGLAAFGPTMMSVVADFTPVTHLGRAYGWYTTALYGGMSIGPAAGGAVAQGQGYLQVFLISGALVLMTFLLAVWLLPSSHTGRYDRVGHAKAAVGLKTLLKNRPLLACWLATLGGCFGLGMFITFVPLHAQNQGLSLGEIGVIFAVQGLTNAVSRIPFGHLSDRVSNRSTLIVIGLIGFVASMVGFGLARNMMHFSASAVMLGISMALAFTSVGALIAEVVPATQRGLAMGGYNTCIYLGMMLSSAIIGALLGTIGFANGFHLTALVNVLMIFCFYLLIKGYVPARQQSHHADPQ